MRKWRGQKGVALLIVIATVGLLAGLVTDLMFTMTLNHEMILNEKFRLQAYYLAKSSVNFSKLLLIYNKKIEGQLSNIGVDAATAGALGYQPLYKMLPLSSSLLRGLLSDPSSDDPDQEISAQEDDAEGEEKNFMDSGLDDEDQKPPELGMLKQEKVKEFLDFDGDFESEITEEQSKFSLNAVSKMTTTATSGDQVTAYDLYKKILLSILLRPEFKNDFENQEQDAEDLVHALADYVDANDAINEFDRVERGPESSLYRDVDYSVKNAKMLSLSEMRLVPGMTDDIYQLLEPLVTVYQTSDKINICLADEELVDALIVHYTANSGCTQPIRPDDKEKLSELRQLMMLSCPDASGVAYALNVALGLKENDASTDEISGTGGVNENEDEKSKKTTSSSHVDGCAFQFEDMITSSNSVFRIKGSGLVNDVRSTIHTVVDASGADAASWKILYYQVE